MKEEKKMITNRSEFNLYSGMMTEEAFFNKFELSISLATEMAAEDAMVNAAFDSRQMTPQELQKEFFQKEDSGV